MIAAMGEVASYYYPETHQFPSKTSHELLKLASQMGRVKKRIILINLKISAVFGPLSMLMYVIDSFKRSFGVKISASELQMLYFFTNFARAATSADVA